MNPSPPERLVALDGSTSAWCGGMPPVLDSILDAADQLAPGTHVGICVANSHGSYTTLVGTGPLVTLLDELQYALDEGPSLTTMREGHTVIVDDADHEHRWPTYMSRAVDLGLRSYLGVPISFRGKTLGGLNMYSTARTPVDAGRLAYARLFATQAAIALGQTQRENDLVLALQSSRTIGKAIGLVMERFDLDDHEAFEYLAKLSQTSNVKLRDVAAHLVKQSNELRHWTQARQPIAEEHPHRLTLVPRPDATDERGPDVIAGLQPLPTPTTEDEIPTLLADPWAQHDGTHHGTHPTPDPVENHQHHNTTSAQPPAQT